MPPRYIVLAQDKGETPTIPQIEALLNWAGFVRWDGNGLPSFVVFARRYMTKGDYFEAGYWSGAGVPLFFMGDGYGRTARRGHLAECFHNWHVANGLTDLLDVMEKAGLKGPYIKRYAPA